MRDVNIAILGLGTVGGGVYTVIQNEKEKIKHKEGLNLNVTKVLALGYSVDIPDSIKAKSIDEVVNDPSIDVVVEVMGGQEPAKTFILKALKAGKTVVSANKDMISTNWPELEKQAKETGAGFYFEASVGGGIPILRSVYDSMQANTVDSIMAIINGTTNFILSKMSDEGKDFDEVLKEAQELGYAEANPTSDVEGFDATYKLSILSSMAFHARIPVSYVHREGITKVTKEDIAYGKDLGYAVKLLAIAKRRENNIEVRVHPTMIPVSHPLAGIKGSYNAIFMHGSSVGDVMFYGMGAGALPTASAIVSDIIYSCNATKHKYMTFENTEKVSPLLTFENNWETEYFIRLNVADEPGVLANISKAFGDKGVSLDAVIQKPSHGEHVPLVLVTHKAPELAVMEALTLIEQLDDVIEVANCIRVEK